MIPRGTLKGWRFEVERSIPIAPARRVTFLGTERREIPNAWTPLHDGTVKDAESLLEWEKLIPSFGCECRKDYCRYKKENPPDFSSQESLWLWGWRLHNYVNRKLGRREISIEEARAIWLA